VRSPEGLPRRLLTAAALLGVFLITLFLLDPRVLATLVGAVLALAAREWAGLAGLGRRPALFNAAACVALYAALAAVGGTQAGWREALFALAAAFWLILVPLWLLSGFGKLPGVALAGAGAAVLAVAGIAAISLSPLLLFLVLGLVWIADTAAYFAGHAFGRRRLAPLISPGKTWEGVAGALAATLAYAIIFALPGAPLDGYAGRAGWAAYLAAVVLLCGVSVLGDLFESALKRRAGVKDSGSILPGHGGVLDRLDSVLPTLPIAAALLHWTTLA